MKRLAAALLFVCACSHPTYDTSARWPAKPDPALTPGATLNVTRSQVCTPGYSKSVRNVPTSEAQAVFAAYHVPYSEHGKGELDHLISLELGGSNDQTNLWPQYGPRPNKKDGYEDALHRAVCAGSMTLAAAQKLIVNPANWPK